MTDRSCAGNGVSHTAAAVLPIPSRPPQTTAEQIAVNLFAMWGTAPSADTWQRVDGPELAIVAAGAAASIEQAGRETRRYNYLDGSAIVTSRSGWEIGFMSAEVLRHPALAYRPANGHTVGALYYPPPGTKAAPAPVTAGELVVGGVRVTARDVRQLRYDYERNRATLSAVVTWLDSHGAEPGGSIVDRLRDAFDRAAIDARNAMAEAAEAAGWDEPGGWGDSAGRFVDADGVEHAWGGCVSQPAAMAARGVDGGAL